MKRKKINFSILIQNMDMEFLIYDLSRKRSFHRRVKHLDEYMVQFAYKQAARRHRATQHTSSLNFGQRL